MKHKIAIAGTPMSVLLLVPLLTQSVQAQPKGKLVIAYANLGNEATDTVKNVGRNEEAILESMGDSLTVQNWDGPNPYFKAIHPKKYTEKVGEKNFGNKPIYAGPWKFVKQLQGEYVEFEAFEGHFRKVPYAKTLIVKSVPEASTRLAMLKTGESDVLYYSAIGPKLKEMQNDPNIRIIEQPAFSGWYAVFTHLSRPDKPDTVFRDKRVRHALSYSIDRQLIIDKLFYGYGKPMPACCIPAGTPQWHPDAKVLYDPEKARALLKAAGHGKGLKVKAFTTAREKMLRKELGVDEWLEWGTREWSYGPCAEYIFKSVTKRRYRQLILDLNPFYCDPFEHLLKLYLLSHDSPPFEFLDGINDFTIPEKSIIVMDTLISRTL